MTAAPDPRPAPPWEPDVDLTTFAVVEIPRSLITGPWFSELDDRARWAQMRLICAAWHQTPAGSVPLVPTALADMAGFGKDVAAWLAVEAAVLAHWTLARDDRAYFEPMSDVIEEAYGRRRKKKTAADDRKQRQRIREELAAAGVDRATQLSAAELGEFLATWRGRGCHEMRGQQRSDRLVMLAGEFGWLPGTRETDVRLSARFSTIRGGATGPD